MSIITPVNYTPHEWKNAGAEGAFPLNAERANEIEKGIIDAAEAANKLIISTGDLANDMSLLDNGLQAGRSIADIPEIQDELDDAGSVAQFLLARATARDAKFLRIGDYVDIAPFGDWFAQVSHRHVLGLLQLFGSAFERSYRHGSR